MSHNRIGTITGLSGCGKDFLLEQTRLSGEFPPSLPVVSFGEALTERLQQESVISSQEDRDGLRSLPQEVTTHHTGVLLNELVDRQPLVLNSHTVYRQGAGLAINPASDQRLRPSHYIFVYADPYDIVSWRNADATRKRPQETAEQIELHQAIALGVVTAIAGVMASRLLVVHNTVHDVTANTRKIGGFLRSL